MREHNHSVPKLGAIRAVTCSVPDLDRIEKAYTRYLGYRVVERGQVPRPVADSWGATAATAGCATSPAAMWRPFATRRC